MRLFTTVHILLFLYVISAILFWGFSLDKHSQTIYELEYATLISEVDSANNPAHFEARKTAIEEKRISRTKQYKGEGSTFLLIIVIGALVVYSSFRRSVRLSKQQNNFMLSVTHELKSPIAGMKLNLQTLERHNLDEEKKDMLVARCINEANRLNDLCSNMLLASQMEGRQYKPTKEKLSFTELLEDSLKDYSNRYADRIVAGDLEELNVTGDKVLLSLAINNLLENAIKYTPVDKPVTIALIQKHNTACLQIADNGPGIPDDEKDKIFKKFYRVGNEETRKTKGTGLGLYLTAKIVKQHKGKIHVKDNVPNGATFEVCLPLS
ncbi:MAG: HAMP domain-containing histidine kinase [Chitinophagales bacterium]|nr:HAMP domain-containing histidine kinase [Chitinophagaceae bacterium]MCB9065358.1 HAMP domain-containing histidine kinase [Chitinophagales bacterium]